MNAVMANAMVKMNGILGEILGVLGTDGGGTEGGGIKTPTKDDKWTAETADSTWTSVTGSLYMVGSAVAIIGGMALLIWSVPKVISYIMGGGHGQISMPWIVAALVVGALMVFGGGFSLVVGLSQSFSDAGSGEGGMILPMLLG